MRKRFGNSFSLLMSLLLILQLFVPIANASEAATANSSILPPSNLDYQALTPDDIKLTWSSVYQATGYNIYQIDDGSMNLLGTTKTNSYTINDLPEGSYTYVVSTLSAEGESGPCAPITVDIAYPKMAAPGTFTYTFQNGNDIVLNWGASQYAETYNLYQIDLDNQKKLITSVTSRTYKITNVSEGTYTYAVSSVNAKYGESPLSDPLQVIVVPPVMKAPGNLTFTISNGNDINLKWSAVTYANSYKVYQVINGEKVLQNTVTTTSATLSNMATGTYVFEVHSYSDRFGESQEGSQITVAMGEIAMAPPSGLTYVIKNANDIALSWVAATNATGYKVYQIIDDQKVLKGTVNTTTVTYTNQPAGVYVFEVHSYSDRFGESQEGSQVTVTLGDVSMAAPNNFAYTIKNGNDIALTWDAVTNASNYKVYQIIDGQPVLKSSPTGTTVTFSNMPAGEYNYEVHSYSTRFGESAEGSKLTFTLVLPTIQPPQNLVQTIKSATSFALSWDSAAYASSYKVYQIVGGQKVLKSTVTTTSVTYSNMSPGEYSYEVYTVSSRFGESAESSKLTFTMTGETMQAPANLTYTITNGNDIKLTWSAASYANSYKVYQIIDGQSVLKSTVTTTTVSYANMPGGDYKFVVKSFSTALGESADGAEISFSLVLPTMAAPGNLAFTVQNGNNVVLTWATVPYANSYKVYELVNGQEVLKSTVTALSATIVNVAAGDHTYVVHSVSSRFGESSEGSKLSLNLDQQMMAAPGNLTQSITNGNDITLRWNSVTYATAYKVYQIVDGEKVLKTTPTGTAVTYQNMPAGDYTFEVHSFSDRFGESPEGSQISLTLVFPVMQAPGNLTQSIANGNDITLRWAAATYATNYKVYQIIDGQKVLKNTVTTTSATFTNMPAGDYSYEIHSNSSRFGESQQGSTVNFTLVWPVVQPPVPTVTVFNANNLTFTWQTVPWANEYRLYEVVDNTRQLIYKGTALTYKVYNLSEDTHYYEMTAYSTRFGESAPSKRLSEEIVYPVMQPPVASLKLTSTASAQISWGFVTYANGYNVYEIVDGMPVLLTKNLNNLSYSVPNLSYADHYYYVTSSSNSFGESDPSNTVVAKLIIDTTPPVTEADAPKEWTNQSPMAVTLTATDDVTGVAKTYYAVNDSPFVEGNTLTITEEGENKVSFYSVDKVGNTEAAQSIYVKLDKTAPVTKATASSATKIDLMVEDGLSGVAKTLYSVNGADFVEGTTVTLDKEGVNKVSYYSVDKAGNMEKEQTIEVSLDNTAPVSVANAPTGWSKEDVTVSLDATDTGSGVAKTLYSINGSDYLQGTQFTVDMEGVNKISYYSVDKAGNVEEAKIIEVKIDRTAPVTAANVPTGWQKESVTLNLTAVDTGSGVAKTFYSLNGTDYVEGNSIKVDKEGITKISFYSVDQLGNKESEQSIEVKVDQTAPVTVANAPANWSKGDVTVNLTSTDEQSGVAATYYSIDGTEKVKGTSFTLTAEGIHTVVYFSVDVAGNIEQEKTVEVKIDKTAPVINMNLEDEYQFGTSLQLTYSVKESLSGIAFEKLTITEPSGATETVLENGSTIHLDKQGAYSIIVTVTNAAGASTTIQKQFMVDKIPSTYDYVLFSGNPNQTFALSGSNNTITGKVHVNGSSDISGSKNKFDEYEYVNSFKVSGNNNTFETKEKSTNIDLLQISADDYRKNATVVYKGKTNLSGSNAKINGIVFVDGDLTISGSQVNGMGTVFATGSIKIAGSGINFQTNNDPVAFYSLKDIEISGSNSEFKGFFYAPNGIIRISGSKNTFIGSLVANELRITGSNLKFTFDSSNK